MILKIIEYGFFSGIVGMIIPEVINYIEDNLLFNYSWIKFLNKIKFRN